MTSEPKWEEVRDIGQKERETSVGFTNPVPGIWTRLRHFCTVSAIGPE